MKFGFYIVLTILVSAFITELLLKDSGYVAIYYQDYVVEMSLVIFLLICLALFILLLFSKKIFNSPTLLLKKTMAYKRRHANHLLEQSYLMMAQGNYKKAEKYAKKSLNHCDAPVIAYSQGAIAADQQNLQIKRDEWIRNAYENHPKAREVILLLQAKFQLSDRNFEAALATLSKIKETNNTNKEMLTLMKDLYIELKDWQKILHIMPLLRKFDNLNTPLLNELECKAQIHIINITADTKELHQIWSKASKTLKENDDFTKAFCQKLIINDQEDIASKIITSFLKKNYAYSLVKMYTQLNIDDAQTNQKKITQWIKTHGHRDELLIAVATICQKEKLWGQASRFLQESINITPSAEALFKLGEVLSHLGKTESSNLAFKRALKLQSNLEKDIQV
ncbi:MAG: heme biosynthesis HemY N-terminal domain-containing protein [Woeseiaceae bacterium]|nr:hypothetical protein [Woeseiaceae bacterium]|tara:strand:- start:17453 stop:18634 length:1182 start_codon:yes stop_codon:yes gene_type:complete